MEYREEAIIVLVLEKEEVKRLIIKEFVNYFKLVHVSLLLEDTLLESLGISREGELVFDILYNRA